jgi:hypothetical protein
MGLASGRSPKTGLVPTVILRSKLEESKVQSDVSQQQNRDGEGGEFERDVVEGMENLNEGTE